MVRRSVLKTDGEEDRWDFEPDPAFDAVVFSNFDGEEVDTISAEGAIVLHYNTVQWKDMGSPSEITVTIAIGNTLADA